MQKLIIIRVFYVYVIIIYVSSISVEFTITSGIVSENVINDLMFYEKGI